MAQHDYVAANGSGAVVRGDFNDALLAVATVNSGATSPSTTYAYMLYINTSDGHLYQRNAANTAWIDHGTVSSRLLRAEDIAAGGSGGLLRADGDGSGLSGVGFPVGVPFYWLDDTPPAWALELDGSEISRTTYADLFAVMGTKYGAGDGSTTFNLPDDRANAIRGWDNGRGVDSGRVFGSEQLDQMQQITGRIRAAAGGLMDVVDLEGAIVDGGPYGGSAAVGIAGSGSAGGTFAIDSSQSPGARTGSETRMRNRAYLPCVKY